MVQKIRAEYPYNHKFDNVAIKYILEECAKADGRELWVLGEMYRVRGMREWLLEDKVALRAVKVAFHTNRSGMKTIFERGDPTAHCSDIDAVISEATACKDTYTKRLVGLRLHHQLAMINVDGYRNLARKLAYSE